VQDPWPPRWELTAPESHVLSYRGGTFRGEAISLAVTELVARRIISVEDDALVGGPAYGKSVEPPLDVVLELIRPGMSVRELQRAIRKAFRPTYKYWERHVGPALVDRGLLVMTRPRGLVGAADFDWTDAGREADAQLGRWLELGREYLADWVRSDPKRAAAFTHEAGSAVLLLREQYPELEELSRLSGTGVFDMPGGEAWALGDTAGTHHHAALGHGHEGLGLHGLGLDFGGLLDVGGFGHIGGGHGGGAGHGGGGHGGGGHGG
jgi:hypothetical protein